MLPGSMADSAGKPIACQYCGSEIQVPADRPRFQAAVTHFEAEHVGGRSAAGCPTTPADTERAEEPGVSD